MSRQATCEERIDDELAWEIKRIHKIQRRLDKGIEDAYDEQSEWPLSIETKRTVVIQVSTGGPGDQFECDVDDEGIIEQVTYRFLDWFDGATRPVDYDGSPSVYA